MVDNKVVIGKMDRSMGNTFRALGALGALLLVGCSSFDSTSDGANEDGGVNGPGQLSGTPTNPHLTVTKVDDAVVLQGGSVSITVAFTREQVDGSVTLTTTGLPDGVTAPDVVVPPGASTGTLQLTATGSATQVKSVFSVTATSAIVGRDPAVGSASASLAVRGGKGALDTSFGQAGKLSALLGSGIDATAMELTLYADDRIGAVIQRESTATGYAIRATRDGAMDAAFGASGRQQLPHAPSALRADSAGNLFTAGASGNLRTLVKLKPDGTSDTQFGDGSVTSLGSNLGLFRFQPAFISATAGEIRVYGDYNIGSSSVEYSGPQVITVSLTGQRLTANYLALEMKSSIAGLATRPDNSVLVAGTSLFYRVAGAPQGPALALLHADANGSVDAAFAGGGPDSLYKGVSFVSQAGVVGSAPQPCGILIAPDQKIYFPYATSAGVFFKRFASDGFLDVNFAASGTVGPVITGGSLGQVVSLGSEGILVALYGLHAIRLAKFDFLGQADRNFGTDGISTYSFGNDVETQGARVAVQSDGRIVVLTTAVGSSKDAVLLRFWN